MSSRAGVVAVVTRQDEFLVIRRSACVRAPRAFCFPGGGLERGETEPAALLRELEEELGARARAVRRLYENETPSGTRLGWWLTRLENENRMCPNPAEVESIHWLTEVQLRRLPGVLPTNLDFLDAWRRAEFDLAF